MERKQQIVRQLFTGKCSGLLTTTFLALFIHFGTFAQNVPELTDDMLNSMGALENIAEFGERIHCDSLPNLNKMLREVGQKMKGVLFKKRGDMTDAEKFFQDYYLKKGLQFEIGRNACNCISVGSSVPPSEAIKPIKFNEQTHDFGTFPEEKGKVSCVFKFTNTGEGDLILHNVKAYCRCTAPNWTKVPVRQGETGIIEVAYDPSKHQGIFDETIVVITNFGELNLKVKGEVTPKR